MNGGAVAYLTHSPYGRNGNEITINNSLDYITGNAADSVSDGQMRGTINAYNTTAGMLASTTGNITGIYDMSGGAYEWMATCRKNVSSSISNGSSTKYVTAYNLDSSDTPSSSRCIVGDATYEVYLEYNQAWFSDASYCASRDYPFFIRGGYCCHQKGAGIFSSYGADSDTDSNISFRICLPGV